MTPSIWRHRKEARSVVLLTITNDEQTGGVVYVYCLYGDTSSVFVSNEVWFKENYARHP